MVPLPTYHPEWNRLQGAWEVGCAWGLPPSPAARVGWQVASICVSAEKNTLPRTPTCHLWAPTC